MLFDMDVDEKAGSEATEVVEDFPEVSEKDNWPTMEEDGFLYRVNPETGRPEDIIGFATKAPVWEPTTEEDVQWCLGKIRGAESRLTGLEFGKKVELEAVTSQWDKDIKEAQNRVKWLRTRFGLPLVRIAKGLLAGKKVRSYKFGSGTIGVKLSTLSFDVFSERNAVEWAKEHHPECLKVKSVSGKGLENAEVMEWIKSAPEGVFVDLGIVKSPLKPIYERKEELPENAIQVNKPVDEWYLDTDVKLSSDLQVKYADAHL